jgi:hypothetical protein
MKGLIKLAKQNPEKVWALFQRWYRRSTRGEMPCWIIERFDGEEVHIHLWDYATDAIEDSIRRYCNTKKLDYSEDFTDDLLPTKHLCISKGGKALLRIHNTSCSTDADPFICAHLQVDDAAARTLLRLFSLSIYPKDMAFYRKIYKEARQAPFGN